jgi:hypothetical protein
MERGCQGARKLKKVGNQCPEVFMFTVNLDKPAFLHAALGWQDDSCFDTKDDQYNAVQNT